MASAFDGPALSITPLSSRNQEEKKKEHGSEGFQVSLASEVDGLPPVVMFSGSNKEDTSHVQY